MRGRGGGNYRFMVGEGERGHITKQNLLRSSAGLPSVTINVSISKISMYIE